MENHRKTILDGQPSHKNAILRKQIATQRLRERERVIIGANTSAEYRVDTRETSYNIKSTRS